jgi:proline dehydrogenase
MEFLDRFISQTGKQPADWTEQDIQKYLDYLKNACDRTSSVKKI